MPPVATFGYDYFADRGAFRDAARARGLRCSSLAIRARGPGGEELTIDLARTGAERPRRLLVLLSGVHGVEGPAGSALQRQLIARDLSAKELPDDAALLVVHAANPFGYAWHRRWNEDNVDLNRNFVDFSAPLPRRPDYAALDEWLNPRELSDPAEFKRRGRELVRRHGLPWLHRTLIEGQHEFPRGLYFAGHEPVESRRLLAALLLRELAGVERALLVDLHTGMGDYGECLYLPGHAPGTPGFDWLRQRLPDARFVLPTDDSSSPAVPVAGKLASWLELRAPALRYLTLEFGTVDGERMIASERAENWLFQHAAGARESAQGREILREVRETSAPEDSAWRAGVLEQGGAALGAAWRALFGAH